MDSRQAKQILMFYRPGDTEKGDPKLAEALELAKTDSELAVWFGQHCAAHAIFPVAPANKKNDNSLISKALVLLLTIAVLLGAAIIVHNYFTAQSDASFFNYRERMARLVQRSYPMKNTMADQSKMREYFRVGGGPADFPIPHGLEKLPGKGSAIFTWHNHPVALMGFDAGGNTNLFLFVIQNAAFDQKELSAMQKFDQVGNTLTLIWTNADDVFLLAGPNDMNFLQSYSQ